ncbi:hypothetical protein J2X31_001890 [Flavobacterium arsenatis]|uniref:Uncharacterized protein n=1 Tax=Flavobacterium arsenatis TaxID=1484332 RepID=A0ABU1TPJ8_9FLAO|nr:hypothetical protein [Flavobacterium arsenatis]MDR6967876.1 hypothetical protein [Flavobacterium arsenatis]
MKKYIYLLLLLFSFAGFAQNINDYQYVIVPTKFDFQKKENDYRLNTLTKFNLEKFGFTAFYQKDNLGINYNDRCDYLAVAVKDNGSFLTTKLIITFTDCNNNIVFTSKEGTSKEKDRKLAYVEALTEAFESVQALNYKYSGNKSASVSDKKTTEDQSVEVVKQEVKINTNQLFAQAISNGFQLVDTTPKVVLKMFKTSQTDYYTAVSDTKNGVVFKKNNEWFFEYYENDKLISEKLDIKF